MSHVQFVFHLKIKGDIIVYNMEGNIMKLSLFTNDKSTMMDEIIFSLITALILAGGILLFIYRPSFGIIEESMTMCFGLIMILLAIMYIPCIIYRFVTNDK